MAKEDTQAKSNKASFRFASASPKDRVLFEEELKKVNLDEDLYLFWESIFPILISAWGSENYFLKREDAINILKNIDSKDDFFSFVLSSPKSFYRQIDDFGFHRLRYPDLENTLVESDIALLSATFGALLNMYEKVDTNWARKRILDSMSVVLTGSVDRVSAELGDSTRSLTGKELSAFINSSKPEGKSVLKSHVLREYIDVSYILYEPLIRFSLFKKDKNRRNFPTNKFLEKKILMNFGDTLDSLPGEFVKNKLRIYKLDKKTEISKNLENFEEQIGCKFLDLAYYIDQKLKLG